MVRGCLEIEGQLTQQRVEYLIQKTKMFYSEASREISPEPSGDTGYDGETQTSRNRSDDQKTPVLGRAATFGGLVTSTSRKPQSREQSSKISIHSDLRTNPT